MDEPEPLLLAAGRSVVVGCGLEVFTNKSKPVRPGPGCAVVAAPAVWHSFWDCLKFLFCFSGGLVQFPESGYANAPECPALIAVGGSSFRIVVWKPDLEATTGSGMEGGICLDGLKVNDDESVVNRGC